MRRRGEGQERGSAEAQGTRREHDQSRARSSPGQAVALGLGRPRACPRVNRPSRVSFANRGARTGTEATGPRKPPHSLRPCKGTRVQLPQEKRQEGWRARGPGGKDRGAGAAWESGHPGKDGGWAERRKGRLWSQSLEQAALTCQSPPSPAHHSVLH